MRIGVPKEIKDHEYRVGLSPASVYELIHNEHEVYVQSQAGVGSGFKDSDYEKAGAKILSAAHEVFDMADMVIKVKEPQPSEYQYLKEGQVLFTFLHLAADPDQTGALVESGVIAIAYETVTDSQGRLPLLEPMSEIAGRMSIQVGANVLERSMGGRGVLLGGVPGVPPSRVMVLGGGIVGSNAARMAVGLGAEVTIVDQSLSKLRELDDRFGSRIKTMLSNQHMIGAHAASADLIIGAVLAPGAVAPKVITAEMVRAMQTGSVLIDVAIDQGGCFETSRPTTHAHPTYVVDDVVHYCVTNMPGAVPRTSTLALNNATLPYILKIANLGYRQALLGDSDLMNGLNVCFGQVTYRAVASALGYHYIRGEEALTS